MEIFPSDIDLAAYGTLLLVRVSLVLLAAWVVSRLLKRHAARTRHLLWSLALAAVLSLPALSAWVPPVEVDVGRYAAVVQGWIGSTGESMPIASDLSDVAGEGQAGVQISTRHNAAGAAPPIQQEETGEPWPWMIAGMWMAGVILLLGILVFDALRVRSIVRRSSSCVRLGRLTQEARSEISLSRPVRVVFGDVEAPVTSGVLAPIVLLPRSASAWPDEKLRLALVHEMAHVRRLDYVPHMLAEMACAVYWPNPLVWLARHRLRKEQELACDDIVLQSGTSSYAYAELLLDVARTVRRRYLFQAGVGMADTLGLKQRIRAILDPSTERRKTSVVLIGAVVMAVGVPALSVAALRSAEEQPSEPTERLVDDLSAAPAAERAEPSDADDPPPADLESEESEAQPFTLTVEAESGRLTSPMRRFDSERASGGGFVMVPDQEGYDAPEGGPGRVTFEVDIPQGGSRATWARVIGDHRNDNSFYVSVDGGREHRFDIRSPEDGDPIKRWTWIPVLDASGVPLKLEPGRHTISFRNREDGSRLDAVFFTADESLIPQGRLPLPPPQQTVTLVLEAESPTAMQAPLEIRADDRASGRLYLSAADGSVSRSHPPSDGRARYQVDVPVGGRFVIWARVVAEDDDEDSFWIRVNGGEWTRWNGIDEDDEWNWQLVHDSDRGGNVSVFSLRPGSNTIEIAYREDGARVDQFVVTNNTYVHPSVPTGGTTAVTVRFRN